MATMPSKREAYQSLYGDDAQDVADSRGVDLGGDSSGGSSSSSGSSGDDLDSGDAARALDGSTGDSSGGSSSGGGEVRRRGPTPDEVLNGGGSGGGSSESDPGGSGGENGSADGSFDPSSIKAEERAETTSGGDEMPDESGPMPEDSAPTGDTGSNARNLDGSTGSSSSGSSGGGGTPSGEIARRGATPDDVMGRDEPEQGIEKGGGELEEDAKMLESQLIDQLEDQTGENFVPADVRVNKTTEDGSQKLEAELTESGQRIIKAEQFEREREARDELAQRVQEQTEQDLTRGQDFTIESQERDGQTVFAVDFDQPRDTDVSPSLSTGTESTGDEEDVVSGAASGLVSKGEEQQDAETGEAFGGRGVVEQRLRTGANVFRDRVVDPVAGAAGDAAAANPFSSPFGAAGAAAGALGGPGAIVDAGLQGDIGELDIGGRPEATRRAETEGFVTGAGELVNLPGLAVTGIEAGEFAFEGAQAASLGSQPFGAAGSVVQIASGAESDAPEFGKRAAAAGALAGARFASAARDDPARVGGQLLGSTVGSSAVLGAANRFGGPRTTKAAATAIQPGEELAITAARSGVIPTRLATKVPGVEKSQIEATNTATAGPLGREEAGTGGTGSLLDAQRLDEARGVSGPSRRSKARRAVRESDTLDTLRTGLEDFAGDTRGQLQRGRQRNRDPGESRVDDRARGFDSEIRRAALEQREFSDFQDLDRGGINDPQSPGAATRPTTEGGQSRRRRAQRSEVRGTDELDLGTGRTFELGPTSLSVGVAAGVLGRERAAGRSEVRNSEIDLVGESSDTDTAADIGSLVDTRLDVDLRQDLRTEAKQEQRAESRQETRTELTARPRTESRSESRLETRIASRSEADSDGFLEDDDSVLGGGGSDGDTFTKRLEFGVASPDEVLSGDEGDI